MSPVVSAQASWRQVTWSNQHQLFSQDTGIDRSPSADQRAAMKSNTIDTGVGTATSIQLRSVFSTRVPYTTSTSVLHSGSLTVNPMSSDSWRRGTMCTTVLTSSRALLPATRTLTDLVHVLTTQVFTPITAASHCSTATIYALVRSSCPSTSRLRLSVRSFTVRDSVL